MSDREHLWADLMRRANRGDAAAYARFLSESAPVIRGVVAARGRALGAEVEDVVQEVLLAVHAKRHTWREADALLPWLYAIARYKTADASRRRRGGDTVPVEDLADTLPAEAGGDLTARRDVGRLLGRIDGRSATIVHAIGVEEESAESVAARMGMTGGAVRVAYHRAMTRLRRLAGSGEEGRE